MSSVINSAVAVLVVVAMLFGLRYAINNTNFFNLGNQHMQEVEEWAVQIDTEADITLRQFETVQFDTSVLQSEVYKSLNDRHVELGEPVVGRNDLFLPLQ